MSIVNFYRGTAPDHHGRYLHDVLAWNDWQLEMTHNFIQVLFPLQEPSIFSFTAPLLDESTIAAFRADSGLQANLARAFERMLHFYGFRHEAETGKVVRGEQFETRSGWWVSPFNHNHLRITRILRSLTALGLGDRARAFLDALEEVHREHGQINEETLRYWRAAVHP